MSEDQTAPRWTDYLPLGKIRPAPRNAKEHGASIGSAIDRFGYADGVILDERTTRLVAGHGRIDALAKMRAAGQDPPDGVQVGEDGEWLVPVQRGWASRSDAEAEAFLLAHNQTTIEGGWNQEELSASLRSLSEMQVDLDGLGFPEEELAELLKEAAEGGGGEGGKGHASLAEEFGAPPFSIFDARQGYWQARKKEHGLESHRGREGNLIGYGDGASIGAADTSIFDPVLAELLVCWFAPPRGAVLDPFAGGSVRGIVSERFGRPYTGIDLREEQVAANIEEAKRFGVAPRWIVGDSRDLDELVPDERFDLILSCPPYHDLESYSDDPRDLSNVGWDEFVAAYAGIIARCAERLRDNRFAAFVVGEVRGPDGAYRGFVPLTISAFEAAGLRFYNEAVLATAPATAGMRARNSFLPARKLVKVHQNVLIFVKGDARAATAAIGDPRGVRLDLVDEPPPEE